MLTSSKALLALSMTILSQGHAFTPPKTATTLVGKQTQAQIAPTSSTSLHLRFGKSDKIKGAAKSKEADLEKTINAILQHIESEDQRLEAAKERKERGEEIRAEKRSRRIELPELITNEKDNIMLRSKRSTDRGISLSFPGGDEEAEEIGAPVTNGLDEILSKLTSLFPVFVLSSAIVGMKKPSALTWVNKGQIIPIMLSAVMMAMGMTLKAKDFTRILKKDNSNSEETSIAAIPAGVSCQYVIMPLTAFLIGSKILLPQYPAAFLGLVLVGCSPGGTASNLVALIAKADVALSIILTSVSTILASLLTPLLVKVLVGGAVSISGWALCKATTQVVLVPVILGMLVNEKIPKLANFVSRYASFAGVVLVSLLCGGVVAHNAAMTIGSSSTILYKIIGSVLGLHTVGFAVGYLAPKKLFGLPERVSRTISIETGMQNSALAVVLARSVLGADPANAPLIGLACLPGALSATAHSCLGSALAVYWRWVDKRRSRKN